MARRVRILTALSVKNANDLGYKEMEAGCIFRSADWSKIMDLPLHVAGKARSMGLGPLQVVTLAEARDLALACRKKLLDGIDPIEERRARALPENGSGSPNIQELRRVLHCLRTRQMAQSKACRAMAIDA